MTRAGCPTCRLRFTGVSTAHLDLCPACRGPLEQSPWAYDLLGYRLFTEPEPASDHAAGVPEARKELRERAFEPRPS